MKAGLYGLILCVSCWSEPAVPQTNPPKLLVQIMRCAATDKFRLLGDSVKQDHVFRVSWARSANRDSGIGEEFFIIVYHSKSEGDVFVFKREYEHGKTNFYLGNNAGFKGRAGRFRYTNEPLGGIWTQEHVRRNVNRALRSRSYFFTARGLTGRLANVGCHSYFDPG